VGKKKIGREKKDRGEKRGKKRERRRGEGGKEK